MQSLTVHSAPPVSPSQLGYDEYIVSGKMRWEDETVRERTGHPPSYAEAKKLKLLILHPHGCLKRLLFIFVVY